MIQHFRFGAPLPTDSVVQEIPVSAGPVPFLTAEEDGWAYRMAPDAIVYGLGEMPRGINKRGWHYVTNNTDEARHSEDKVRTIFCSLTAAQAVNALVCSSISRAKCATISATPNTMPCALPPKSRIMSFTSSPATT